MKTILDRKFKYVPSHETCISKTFARVRKEQKEREEAEARHRMESAQKIRNIR